MTTALTVRLFSIGLSVLTVASPAYAEDLLAQMRACAAERDDARRLACYDAQLRPAPRKPQATGTSRQEPQAIPGESAAAVAAAEQQFGMTEALAQKSQPTPAPPRLDKLRARVVAVSRKPRGEPIVTLENGQVWEAADGEPAIELKTGDVVTIWRGVLGSFRLSGAGNSMVRVSRVR